MKNKSGYAGDAADAHRLAEDLIRLGLRAGDTVLMHSSLRSLGPLQDGPATLINALLQVLTPQGTLLVPTLSYAYTPQENPVFDVRLTGTCIGAVPEFFRKLPGVRRSLSPTHSVAALGQLAVEITGGQLQDETPVGPHSPFARLAKENGKLLFVGCGLRPNTSMHGVEELAEPPYLFLQGTFPFTVVDENGAVHDIHCRRHNFVKGDRHYEQRYDRIEQLLDSTQIRRGFVANAECYLLEAAAVWEKGCEVLRKDPFYFVDLV